MIETHDSPAIAEHLAQSFSEEILVKEDLLAAPEGEIVLSAHREDGEFGRIVLRTSSSSARREPRFSTVQIRRLARDVRAKVQARAASITPTARQVTVTIYPRPAAFDIAVTITFR